MQVILAERGIVRATLAGIPARDRDDVEAEVFLAAWRAVRRGKYRPDPKQRPGTRFASGCTGSHGDRPPSTSTAPLPHRQHVRHAGPCLPQTSAHAAPCDVRWTGHLPQPRLGYQPRQGASLSTLQYSAKCLVFRSFGAARTHDVIADWRDCSLFDGSRSPSASSGGSVAARLW
ncbi:uncharacterized protein SOCE26_038080 [Sorangium cellulosum]|uniref:RNA polymerase sigma-70 region 2 domain-containing protein n=1 Tax=Sorangium cellulosum TaxID=56 RepID=A0A2L0EST7_SORCE|nr:uncharacterized protein SOCE26_038080 [Sorangium cellulosum]